MRIEGWEGLLVEHIAQARNARFEWGSNDCALWCAAWILKITGRDLAADWRGKYATEAEALALMAKAGFSSYADLADGMGYKVVGTSFAQRGDIVLHPHGCLGICDGMISYFLMADGFTRLHTHRCLKAWKVE